MMTISPIAGDSAYYANKDNYYVLGSLESRWMGEGAEKLGLSGPVIDTEMDAMKKGILPDGTTLSRVENGKETHRAGYDLTFSAPKSISMLALMGGEKRFIEAHNEAVAVAMKEVESLASARITENKHTTTVMTGNIVAALYNHDTSRDLDPQLHTHALVFNATEAEGKWRALASDTKMKTGFSETVFANQIALGNIYRHSLRQSVEAMGYKTHDTGKNGLWEIEGVPVEPFSQRSQAIKEAVGDEASLKSRDMAALDTRKAKVASDPLILVAEWNNRLKETGFNMTDFIGRAKAREGRTPDDVPLDNLTKMDMTKVVNNAVSLLSESKVQFTYSDLFAKTAGQMPAEPGLFDQVRKGIDTAIEQQKVIPLDKEKGIFTSDIHLLNELSVHQLAKSVMQEGHVLSFPEQAQPRERSYADVYSVLAQDKSSVAILSGRGGAAVQRERVADAVIMAKEQGREVTVLAADRRSGVWLGQDEQIAGRVMERSQLTADFTLPAQSTLVIDQSEKLTLKETLLLLEKGQEQNVQLLFIDSQNRQGTGNALSVLKDAGVPQYQFYGTQKLDAVVISESDKRARYESLATEYVAMKSAGEAVTAQVNGPREQATLTAVIRDALKGKDQLADEDTGVSVLLPVWLDSKSRHQRDNYRPGMVMEQWDQEKKEMTRYQVDRVTDSTNTLRLISESGDARVEKINTLDSSWSLFSQKSIPVAVGEQLTAVGRELKGQIKARDPLTVTAVNAEGLVVEHKGKSLVLDTTRALKLSPAYVESLGASVSDKNTILVAASAKDLNSSTLNQMTRSGDSIKVFTALPQDRAEKRLSSHPQYRLASEQVKNVAGHDDLEQAMNKNQANLLSPVQQSVALGLSRAQTEGISFSEVKLISSSIGWSSDVSIPQIKAEIAQQRKAGDLIDLAPTLGAGSGLLVARATYDMEKSIIRTIAQGKGAVEPLMDRVPETFLTGLTQGQKTATSLVLESRDQFLAIQGFAGTGKTTQFKAIMAAISSLPEDQQPKVIGLAPTHRAVHEMQEAGVRSQTLASFLSEERQKGLAGEKPDYSKTLFLLDEQSMVGNRDMAEIYRMISHGEGRAISSGDTAQLKAIDPGQPFKLIQQRSAIDTAVMKDIVRQTPALKPAIYSMIEGNAREALIRVEQVTPAQIPRNADSWQPGSSVMEFKDEREDKVVEGVRVLVEGENVVPANAPVNVIEAVSRDFAGRTADARNETLIVAHLNADRHAINSQIHEQLYKAGELGEAQASVTVLEPVRTLHHELRAAKGFSAHIGEVAVMNNTYFTVGSVDTAAGVVELKDREGNRELISNLQNSTQDISLYKPRNIAISPGDKMRFTRSDNERGYVANSVWKVSDIGSDGTVTLNDGTQDKRIEPGRALEDQHVDLAYAVTAYGAQGASSRYVIALEGVEGARKHMATQEGGYVTLSRAKEHVQVYTDNREGWLNTLNKQANQHTAHDLLHHADDKSAQVAERLLATATPLQDTALGRKLLDTSGLAGESMAHFIAPGKKYPSPHIALPVWDSNGNRAGVYLDEVRFQKEGRGAWLSHEPRVMGSDDARFAGLQVSRNGETHVAASMQAGLQLAHDNPDSGVIIRLAGEGLPSNINRITGNIIVPEDDTTRQAQTPTEEPLPFIPDEAEKRAAELDKQAREVIPLSPEKEKEQQIIEKVAELRATTSEDILKSFNPESLRKEDLTLDKAIQDVARTEMPHERLQQLERDIVKQKTFGE